MRNRFCASLWMVALLPSALLLSACDSGDDQPEALAEPAPVRLMEDVENWRAKYEELVSDQQALQDTLAAVRTENDGLREELEALKSERETLKDKVAALEQPRPQPPEPTAPQDSDDSRERLKRVGEQLKNPGEILLRQGQYKIARTVLRVAQQAGAESAQTHFSLARCEAALADHEAARKHYELALAALESQPEEDPALLKKCLNNYGATLLKLGESQKAEQTYRKIVALDETYTPTLYNLGLLYATELNRPDEAIAMLRQHVVHGGRRGVSARDLIRELQGAQDQGQSAQ